MANGSVWVTGATGRIGRDVASRLERAGARVVPLVLPGFPLRPKRVPWTATARPVSVGDAKDLDGLPPADAVIHCHWLGDRRLGLAEQIAFEVESNIRSLAFLWTRVRAQAVARVVNVSSIRVFSHLNGPAAAPDATPRPATPYGIAKLAGECYLDAAFDGTPAVVVHLRLGHVVCHGGHPSQITSRLCAAAFDGRPIRIHAGRVFQPVFIGDAVESLVGAAFDAEPGRRIVAGGAVTTDAYARRMREAAGRPMDIAFDDTPPAHVDPIVTVDAPPPTSLDEMIAAVLDGHRRECAGRREAP